MNIAERIFRSFSGRLFRSLSIAAFIAIFTFISLVGFYLNGLSANYDTLFSEEFGNTITLTTEGKDISYKILEQLAQSNYVLGYNCNSAFQATSENFDNFIPNEEDNFDQFSYSNKNIVISGNTNTEFNDYFIDNTYSLVEGTFPAENTNEIMVEESLARYNNLNIGDVLKIGDISNNNISQFVISGIYQINTGDSLSDSILFCRYDMLKTLDESYQYKSQYTIYVDSMHNLSKVKTLIGQLVGKDSDYSYVDSISNASEGLSGVHQVIKNTTNILINVSYVSALLILILMTYLWMRDHFAEAGIYIALGQKRSYILLEFALEVFFISVCTIIPCSILAYILINQFGLSIVDLVVRISRTNYIYQDLDKQILQHTVDIKTVVKSIFVILGVVLISTFLSGISILKYRARELFNVRN